MKPSFFVVIPARYASSRLVGKPLAEIAGQPMIWHVWQRAIASGAERVIIATDHDEIRSVCEAFGADVEMTAEGLASGSDRIAAVARLRDWAHEDIVVNVQGDEPLLPSVLIDQVAACLAAQPDMKVATLGTPFEHAHELMDENLVKVVCNQQGGALYFSRAPLAGSLRHIGIYAYRIGALQRFVGWEPSPLERVERLEQLRWLENGDGIAVATASEVPPAGVDTDADLSRVRQLLANAS